MSRRLSRSVMPSAFDKLPGPRQRSASVNDSADRPPERARRRRIRSIPSSGTSARSSTAAGKPSALGDDVHQEVKAVVQVDVGDAGRAVERLIASCGTGRGVTGRVVFADVGLDFDDAAGRAARGRLVDEDLAEEIRGDVERRPRVEVARQPTRGHFVAPAAPACSRRMASDVTVTTSGTGSCSSG